MTIRRLGSVQKAIAQHEKRWGKLRTKLARKRPVFWVTRNKPGFCKSSSSVRIYHTKPRLDGGWWSHKLNYVLACSKWFFRATGLKVRPGQCLKVRFSAEVIP
jgi:hypothetical protein